MPLPVVTECRLLKEGSDVRKGSFIQLRRSPKGLTAESWTLVCGIMSPLFLKGDLGGESQRTPEQSTSRRYDLSERHWYSRDGFQGSLFL